LSLHLNIAVLRQRPEKVLEKSWNVLEVREWEPCWWNFGIK